MCMFSNLSRSATLRVGLKAPYLLPAKRHVWRLLGGKSDDRINARAVAASERWQTPSGVSDPTYLVSSQPVLHKLADRHAYP